MSKKWNVLVTGGAGYVGSALVPRLLEAGHAVTVLDLYIYGDDHFADLRNSGRLREVRGDIRDPDVVSQALEGCNAVIHLACISNDPSYDLDPGLGRSINYDSFGPLVKAAKRTGVERFIYASSSSVYGIKSTPNVTEDMPLEPLTDYSKYKALCENELAEERQPGFTTVSIRPSTVCGYASRLRLDLTVNILTNHAVNNGKILVFGGAQKRPNIHIDDMVGLYCHLLQCPSELIDGKVFNAGYENFPVVEIAEMVRDVIGSSVQIETVPTDDNRSYHVNSDKMRRELEFEPQLTIADAVQDLVTAFDAGLIHDPMNNPQYFNIKKMQDLGLK